jgi:hypothetical protein
LKEAKGDVSLVCLNSNSHKFIFDNDDSFEEDEIDEFIGKFLKNKLKPNYKSEIEPKDNSKRLVKIFVGSTIGSVLEKNNDKDVVIYFHNKYCGQCGEFDPLYSKLAKHFSKNKKILFGKLDTDKNEHPEEFTAKSYPALFIRKANSNNPQLFDYSKESTLEDLIHFIDKSGVEQGKSIEKQEL